MDSQLTNRSFSAIILSAGRSTRMGMPKFSLRFDEESTFLEKIADSYCGFGCKEIVIVMNSDGIQYLDRLKLHLPANARVVLNDHPEWARFYSLKTGAKNLQNLLPAFVSNIDNPFVSHEILRSLSACSETYDYIFPTFNGSGGHPFLISEKVIEKIITGEDDQVHMRDFLTGFRHAGIEVPDEKILLNINTSAEFRKFFSGEM